jgi:hypothetical protein
MDQEQRLRLAELEAEKELVALGYDAAPILPLVRAHAREMPSLSATEIIAVLKAEHAESFKPREATVQTKPAERTLADMTEREKIEYIAENGYEKYRGLVARQSEFNRSQLQRQLRGY